MIYEAGVPLIPRKQAVEDFEMIRPMDASERVLSILGPDGGEGKTWALLGLQKHCQNQGIECNRQLIDFYDTANQRVSGVMASIVSSLDPVGKYFEPYLAKRRQFDDQRSRGYGGEILASLLSEMKQIFGECLINLARDRRTNGKRGVALFFDTWEIIELGRVSEWLLNEFLPIAKDVAVVIGGRSRIATAPGAPGIREYQPSTFSLDEVAEYVGAVLGPYDVLDQEAIDHLARHLLGKTGGVPVLVSLALDIITLRLLPYLDPDNLDIDSIVDVLEEIPGDRVEETLLEDLIHLLGAEGPERQWAILYMALFRRRFNADIYAFLHSLSSWQPVILETFKHLYIVKYRELGERSSAGGPPEINTLLHDRIRDDVNKRYWEGSIPISMVLAGRRANLFPPDLDRLWESFCDEGSNRTEIPASDLGPIIAWLNERILEYYKSQQDALRRGHQTAKSPAQAVEMERRRHALSAEELLYELDGNVAKGWERWRRVYYEAFEAYQEGFCEQLELTVLSAWTPDELATDRAKCEIHDMVRVRQQWWKIPGAATSRQHVIKSLEELLLQQRPSENTPARELHADIYGALGWAYSLEGNNQLALSRRRRAVDMSEELGLEWNLALQLDFLGHSYDMQGDFKAADDAWTRAFNIARNLKPIDRYRLASVAMKRAHSLNLRGQTSPALGYTQLAATLFTGLGDLRSLGLARSYQGRIYQAMGKFGHAERMLKEAESHCTHFGGPDDRVRLLISQGELYRRRIGSKDRKRGDYDRAKKTLEQASEIARENDFRFWQAEAEGELGALFRDEANRKAKQRKLEEAEQLWQDAEKKLTSAMEMVKEESLYFRVADLLDDLCDLYSMEWRKDPNQRRALEEKLLDLEKVAEKQQYQRYISSAADRRATLLWNDGEYDQAMKLYVQACAAVSIRTRSGSSFRSAYDRLVGIIEEKLRALDDPALQVRLAEEGIHLWSKTGHLREHQQFTLACQRILYPAQSTEYEGQGDAAFDEKKYPEAFDFYLEACEAIGRVTSASFQNYEHYMDVVNKIERRLYDLGSLNEALHWSEYIEEMWHRRNQTVDHPALLEVCHRIQEMAHLSTLDFSQSGGASLT
ncbi:MAG: tetratricopeptide repeat protein [Anaerolineae bacterium]|nr:tetratricopeptide repeat protein [Anaerolineae bacterium]